MSSPLSIFVVILLLAWSVTLSPYVVAEEPLFSLFDQGLTGKDKTPDRIVCERVVYGKNFDNWLKAYSEGRSAEATAQWAKVLNDAGATKSLYELVVIITGRLEFLEGKQTDQIEKSGGINKVLIDIYRDTEKQLGPCEKTASIADYIIFCLSKSNRYREAITYAQKSLDIRQNEKPRSDKRVFQILLSLCNLQIEAHDYAAAEKSAKSAMVLAEKAHSEEGKNKVRRLIVTITKGLVYEAKHY